MLQLFAVDWIQDAARAHQFDRTLDVDVGHDAALVVLWSNTDTRQHRNMYNSSIPKHRIEEAFLHRTTGK